VKDLLNKLDLKEEVVLTMLNQLQNLPGTGFFKVEGILPVGV
jgi:hypothetical protein